MRFKTTLLLLVSVLGLGAFIWFVERRADSTERRETRARYALRMDPAKVTALHLVAGDVNIDCEKQGKRWRIIKPVEARADAGEVARILDELARLPRGEVITASEQKKQNLSMSDYGFDPPRARIMLRTEQRDMTVLIGRDAALGGSLYIKEEGQPDIISTGTNILAALPRDVVELRDRRIFDGFPADVTSISMRRPEGFLQLSRDAQGLWRIRKPLSARAAGTAVQELLDQLFELRVAEFVTDSFEAASLYGLDEPLAQVTLATEKQEQTLLLGKVLDQDANRVYATVEGVEAVYTVASNSLETLRVRVDRLRDRRLVVLPAYDITYIQVEEGERVVKLLQTNDAWHVVEPKQYRADAQRVQVLLSEWSGARADAYSDEPATNLAELGLDPPARKILLARSTPVTASTNIPGPIADPAEAVQILISSADAGNGRIMVKVDGEDSLYLMASDPIHAISLDPLYYRDHEVLAIDPASVRTLAVQRSGKEEAVERDSTNTFRAAGGGKQAVDMVAIDDMLTLLRGLRAVDLIAEDPTDLALYGLDAPAATLAVGLARGTAGLGKSLLIGAEIPGDYVYAMVKGQDVVFTLEKGMAVRLTHGLYNVPSPSEQTPVENGTNKTDAGP